MRKSTLVIALLILVIIAGCTIPFSEEIPEESLLPAGTPGQSPTPSGFADSMLYAHIDENNAAIKSLVDYSDLTSGLPQYNEQDYSAVSDYLHVITGELSPAPFDGLDTSAAEAELKRMLEEQFDITANCSFEMEGMDPALLAVLLYTLNGSVDDSDAISVASTMDYTISKVEGAENTYAFDMQIGFPNALETIESVCRDNFEQYMNIRFMYAYMLTIYDSEGEMADAPGNTDPLPEQWVFPLASHTRLTDTWLAERSNGTRKHTGTDVLADEGTEIYSCNNAKVLSVGYSDGTGNYVWTRDDFGYEYIYMHMVELTAELNAGDSVDAGGLIGKVGSTGNSATNHLHLSVITPDNDYLNPYAELALALERKNNPEATTTPEGSTEPSTSPQSTTSASPTTAE